MDLTYLLAAHKPNTKELLKFGFKKNRNMYTLHRELEGALEARFKLTGKNFSVQVFDLNEGEAYLPFELDAADGNFVRGIRNQVDKLIHEIVTQCCSSLCLRDQVLDYAKEQFGTEPAYPWPEYPQYCTLKVKATGKWYGIIMNVTYKVLGLGEEGNLDVMNVKLPPERVEELVDGKQFLPAYHMNKKYWLTILLNGQVTLAKVKKLVAESYATVTGKKKTAKR